jgi:hypothetical protein
VEFLSEVLDNCINVILFIGSEGNRVALRISASAEIEIAKTYSYFEHLFDIDETLKTGSVHAVKINDANIFVRYAFVFVKTCKYFDAVGINGMKIVTFSLGSQ